MLEEASAYSGVANVDLDGDGVVRRMPALVVVEGSPVPGFAVKVTRLFLGSKAVELEIDAQRRCRAA